jgi:outer membrane protein OmpA-like peptidoglycan-associated protein
MFYYAAAGFSFSFFADEDSDGDGVIDKKDMCPDTPEGIKVDKNGCPVDSDNDGVPDYKDKCPNTPRGVQVNQNGCPLDSDNDGVPDYKDICPDTPQGVKVDDLGCPLDSDGDGVPDYIDKCPDTPAGVKVDNEGCPVDSDLDGVPDYKDKCPGTPAGTKVDSDGCPQINKAPLTEGKTHEVNKLVLNASTGFGSGSSSLLPSAYSDLDMIANVMRQNPDSRWKIVGYTDNVGSEAANEKPSYLRARSVLQYFLSKGLGGDRFQVSGLGEKYPVAPNSTAAGRAKNRRVEIIRIK